jgi:N-acetylneuraminate synthase
MIVDRNLHRYVVRHDCLLKEAATQVTSWQGQIAFCVDESGRLIGSISNGDLIRWIAAGSPGGTAATADEAANHAVKTGSLDNLAEIERLLETVLYVPIIDRDRRIVAVARRRHDKEGMLIGDRVIGIDQPAFIIAEIGNNHTGSSEPALRLIAAARQARADCAKFQMRDMRTLYGGETKSRESADLGTEYLFDLLNRFQLAEEELYRCFDYTASLGMIPLCTAWEQASADRCKAYGLPAIKLASADLTNHDLIRYVSRLEMPMFCSTGMSTEAEIVQSVDLLRRLGAQYVLLHCNSTYPAPFRDINLSYMARLADISGGVVGYSGHERDVFIGPAAVALGARVIEKHISLDRSMEGNDHKVSLLPDEFRRMVDGIRQVEESFGSDAPRSISQGERSNRVALSKSVFAVTHVKAGTVIEAAMLTIRSPGQGLQPNRIQDLIGAVARRNIAANTPFHPSDLDEVDGECTTEALHFDQPWGVPVRHRDVKPLFSMLDPDFVEFHLSYRDLNLDDAQILGDCFECGLVVHAPELFEGDHTLDLAAPDPNYRARSVREMIRVVEKTVSLSRFFKVHRPTGIICNVGGFSSDRFLTDLEREQREEWLLESWAKIVDPRVEIWPQTMPPYPWHFGGQRFHNLFVLAEDIVRLCGILRTRICLDVSHSRLACNEFGKSFDRFLDATVPITGHLHLADAKGAAGEGLQIGEGEIDFEQVFRILAAHRSHASFIPEIWQGHENDSLGARIALSRLNRFARLARKS